jgi:hypothetical protein
MGYGETRVQPLEPKPRGAIEGMAPYITPKKKKFSKPSAEKIVVTVFWDEKGVIPVFCLLGGQK